MRVEKEEIIFDEPVSFTKLIKRYVSKFIGGAINAANTEIFQMANTAPVDISFINNGQIGQTIYLLGDGQTTLLNNGNVSLRTGSSLLLQANLLYRFTFIKIGSSSGKWYSHQ